MSKDNRAKTVVARVLSLKRFPSLSELSPAALTPLAERVREARFRAGETVAADGAFAGSVHFVLEGEIELRRRGRKSQTLSAGDVSGEIEAFAASPTRAISARATTATRTLVIDRAGLFRAQEDSFPLQRAMLKRIGSFDLAVRRRLGWKRVHEMRGERGRPLEIPDRLELGHRVASLRATPELSGLRIRTLGRLATGSEIVDVPAGASLWKKGDRADFAVQVLRGSLECGTDDDSFRIPPNTLIGLVEALADGERWCNLAASSDVLAIRLEAEHILDELEDDTDVAMEFMTTLASEAAKLEDLVVDGTEMS